MAKQSILMKLVGITAPSLEEIASDDKASLKGVVFTYPDRIMYAKTGTLGSEDFSRAFEVDEFPFQKNPPNILSVDYDKVFSNLDDAVYELIAKDWSARRDSLVRSICLHKSRLYDSGDYGIFDTHANAGCTDKTLSLKFPLIASHNDRMYASIVYPDGVARITELDEDSADGYKFESGRILFEMKADEIKQFSVDDGEPHDFSGYISPVSVIHTDGKSFFLNGKKVSKDKNLKLKEEEGKIGAFSIADNNIDCSFIIYPKGKNIYFSVIDNNECLEAKRYLVYKGTEQILAAAPVMHFALDNKIMALRMRD